MRICITGSKGFIGKALKKRLEEEGHIVIDFDRPECNIMDDTTYPKGPIDLVIHAAAVADLNVSAQDMQNNYAVNVIGTYDIAEWCEEIGAKMLYISTCCAWGNARTPEGWPCIDGETCPLPTEVYAHSKLAGEESIKSSALKDYMIFRIGTVYGPGMREALYNYRVIDSVIKEKMIYIYGGGNQRRQYIYIYDLVDAFVAGIRNWQNGATISVCGAERISVRDSVQVVAELLQADPITVEKPGRKEEDFDQWVSLDNARNRLRWEPETSFIEGMRNTIKWYMETKLD